MLGTDPDDIVFNLYWQTGKEKPVRLNKTPITESTNFVKGNVNFKTDNTFFVRAVVRKKEQEMEKGASYTLSASASVQQYIYLPLKTPAGYTPDYIAPGNLFGDWREELKVRTDDNYNLRVYTTTIPTKHRIFTLLHDPQYRLSVTARNDAYYQLSHTSFFPGTGMNKIPKPNIVLVNEVDNSSGKNKGKAMI